MTLLALLRHGPTLWNTDGRMQGRSDEPLLDESRAELTRRRIPDAYAGFRALSSPLMRCLETATLLRLVASPDKRLVEMDWGGFQGYTLAELRTKYGADLVANEARGLDFRPPGGESPRDVQARVAPLLAEIGRSINPMIAVTHRGVIRAIYARAIGWDMMGEPPHGFDPYALHLFRLDSSGNPALEQLNIPLAMR